MGITVTSGTGVRVSVGMGCGIREGNKVLYGISILTLPHKLPFAGPAQAGRNEPFVCIAVLSSKY